jgi:hypothetical protein
VAWNYCAAPGLAFTGGFTCKEIDSDEAFDTDRDGDQEDEDENM